MHDMRKEHLVRFYQLMAALRDKCRGYRYLEECNGRMEWPRRGVYFFFEKGEKRADSGEGLRVIRVGTHAVSTDSKTTLWKRLSQHKGTARTGGGNHRGSIFRLLTGQALMTRNPELDCPSWGKGSTAPREIRLEEHPLELEVSKIIRTMPLLWVEVNDKPSKHSLRSFIERNSIALLSNAGKPADERLDPPSTKWLGLHSSKETVRASGLWNSRHVSEQYDPAFLDILERLIK